MPRRRPPALGSGLQRAALLLALALAAALPPTHASAHDGDIRWRTLTTPHFRVHFPARLHALGRRTAAVAEDAYQTLSRRFDYRPARRVELTIDDYVDSANGFATPFPFDHIHVRAWPPDPGSDLADNGDWLRGLVFHELAHVMQLSQVSGLSTVINTVLGRTWLPNQFLPRFWVEGMATYVETRFPGRDLAVRGATTRSTVAGRAASPVYLARLRAALRDGTLPELRQITGDPLRWPRARAWYLYGAWLLDYQAVTYGHDRLRRFVTGYGDRAVPYGINLLYREIYGRSALAMWREAKRALARRVAQERALRRQGRVTPRAASPLTRLARQLTQTDAPSLAPPRQVTLTRDGEWRGRVRWGPAGQHVVVARAPADRLARIERVQVATGRRATLHVCEVDCDDPVITPDGAWLLWVATRPVRRLYRRREVFAARLPAGGPGEQTARATGVRRLTVGARARDLAVSPDGRWVGWVAVGDDGRTEVRRAALQPWLRASGGDPRPARASERVARARDHGEVLGDVAFDDRGGVWWTAGQGGRRQVRYRPARAARDVGGPERPPALGAARALRALPVAGWRGAGGALARATWVSDLVWLRVGGRPTLSAVLSLGGFRDAATLDLSAARPRWRLRSLTDTGVTSAACSPRGDVAVVLEGGRGQDVALLPGVAPSGHAGPTRAVPPPTVALTPTRAPDSAWQRWASLRYRPLPVAAAATDYTARSSAWPRSWTPSVEVRSDGAWTPEAVILGLQLDGRDALETTSWELQLVSDLAFQTPSAVATLSWSRFEPLWTFSAAWFRGAAWATSGYAAWVLPTEHWVGRVGGAWSYPFARGGLALSWGWRVGHIRLQGAHARWLARALQPDPFGPAPYRPFVGTTSTVTAGLGYNRTERYPNSAVVERRRALSVNVSLDDRRIGSAVQRSQVDLIGRYTARLGAHRALELRTRLGWAPTYNRRAPPFRLSGLPTADLSTVLFGGPVGDLGVVRGVLDPRVGNRVIAGRAMAWGSVALHLPLPAVGSSLELLPLFLGRTWLTLFSDAARIWAGDEALLRHRGTQGGWAVSAGLELAVQLETGYVGQGSLRVGVARALGDVASTQWYLRLAP